VSSIGDSRDIDCASCVESAADKNATAASNAAWRTFNLLQYKTGCFLLQKTYLDTLLILQSPLEHPQHRIDLQIHHQIRTPREDPIRTFPLPSTVHTPIRALCMRHTERLCLESMPRPPAHHRLVREVRDGVDTFPPNIGRRLVREREKKESLERSEGLMRKVVVQRETGSWWRMWL